MQWMKPLTEIAPVLLGQQLGRRHQHRLKASASGARGGSRSDDRLAAADIALNQPNRGLARADVRLDLGEHTLLRFRERER